MLNGQLIVAQLLEDDEPNMSDVNRLLPTKTVRFRGNSMLNATGLVQSAQNEWRGRSKKQKKWALDLIKAWPGLDDAAYLAILNGKCTVTADGDDAVIVIREY